MFSLFGKNARRGDTTAPGPALGVFGKLPDAPEFIAPPSPTEPVASFERWLDAGMGFAKSVGGAAWEEAYARGAAVAFHWPTAHASLLGVLAPSWDSAGRLYPVGLYLVVPAPIPIAGAHLVPAAYGDFLSDAFEVLLEARDRGGSWGLQEALRSLEIPGPDVLAQADAAYADWCQKAQADQVWALLFGDGGYGAAVRTLGATVDALRGGARPATLRLPLGTGGAVSTVFWLDVLRRCARPRLDPRPAFWNVGDGALLVLLAGADPEDIGALWPPLALGSRARDLTAASFDGDGTEPRLSSSLLRALGHPEPRIADVLAALSS